MHNDFGLPRGTPGGPPREIVAQRKALNKHHNKHHLKHKKRTADAYDNDPNTASEYDDMKHHLKFDWGVAQGLPGGPPEEIVSQVKSKKSKKTHHRRH